MSVFASLNIYRNERVKYLNSGNCCCNLRVKLNNITIKSKVKFNKVKYLLWFFRVFLFLTEVKFAVTSQIKYTMQAFWVVSIRELHVSLWRPWKELQDALREVNGTILEASHCQKLATDIR